MGRVLGYLIALAVVILLGLVGRAVYRNAGVRVREYDSITDNLAEAMMAMDEIENVMRRYPLTSLDDVGSAMRTEIDDRVRDFYRAIHHNATRKGTPST